jgi:hypothetical protein
MKMKKILLASALMITISMAFTSCKKDWSCSCTDQNGNSTSTAINNETLLNARAKCKDMSFTIGAASENCSLQ